LPVTSPKSESSFAVVATDVGGGVDVVMVAGADGALKYRVNVICSMRRNRHIRARKWVHLLRIRILVLDSISKCCSPSRARPISETVVNDI
jgi:hypothetical protein